MRWRPIAPIWARDNRGVMVRVFGQPGDPSTHLENRVGEPAANPYLYIASQIYAGLDGIAQRRDPGPSADTPYETKAPALPKNLGEAVSALRRSAVFRKGFGDAFVDYFAHIKEAEFARFTAETGGERPTSPPGSTTSISICFDRRHSGLPRSGKSGIHNHQVSEYGFRARRFAAPRNDDIP